MDTQQHTDQVERFIVTARSWLTSEINPETPLQIVAEGLAFILGSMVGTVTEPDYRAQLHRVIDDMFNAGESYQEKQLLENDPSDPVEPGAQ